MNELKYTTFKEQEKQRLIELIERKLDRKVSEKKSLTKKKRYVKVELWLILSVLCYIICVTGMWLREVM